MTNLLLNPLNQLHDLSHHLFLSLSPHRNKPPPPPPILAFAETDASLAAAVRLARTHQIKQRRIEALNQRYLRLSRQNLEDGRRDFQAMVTEGDERIKAIEQVKAAAIPYPELLAYAQSLSAFTSAPPNRPDLGLPGQAPPPLFFPPFPNEEQMCRGHLSAEEPQGTLGETHSVSRHAFCNCSLQYIHDVTIHRHVLLVEADGNISW
ncbi:hypothetical protein BV25DRAFT_1932295 [Artomyces pyxidatus]|uniref:Uncharacterized protein n=1 Tax=Artomyces pyxidatus TaxID=48021 RepID=A0ACB8T7S0_9AGAM|nr:hypothetical protein BV25DRAFT_1932295 [Artomyces pyxidatus]